MRPDHENPGSAKLRNMKPGRQTWLLARPSNWPLTVRVPAVVVLLMLMVSAVISERVLSRLVETQSRHLTELTGAYLDGVSSAVMPHLLREDVWEIYDVLDRATQRYSGLDIAWTTVVDHAGVIIASSQPRVHVTQEPLPARWQTAEPQPSSIAIDETSGVSTFSRNLPHQGRVVGAIHGEVRIEALIAERWSVLTTLILTNAALALALAAIGYAMVRRMVRPVGLLADHMQVDPGGTARAIPHCQLGPPTSEFGRLFRRYNSLVETVRERERLLHALAEEERLAALGRLSSVMAHEINNPLGGMLTAVQTLKRHGHREDVRVNSVDLIERGLIGMRNVARSTLAAYRLDPGQQTLTREHLEDLALLIGPEVRRKNLALVWANGLREPIDLPAQLIRDATLNLLLNACAASVSGGGVGFRAQVTECDLTITVSDEGGGLPAGLRSWLQSGLETGLQSGSPDEMPEDGQGGLGLWIVRRHVAELQGTIAVEPVPGTGTQVTLTFPRACDRSKMRTTQEPNQVTSARAKELQHGTGRTFDRLDRGRPDHGRKPLADA